MEPRSKELLWVDRCILAARGALDLPRDKAEADVFRYAAMLLATPHPDAAHNLWTAHQSFYAQHPGTPATYADLQASSMMAAPSRFQEMLAQRLREYEHHGGTPVPH